MSAKCLNVVRLTPFLSLALRFSFRCSFLQKAMTWKTGMPVQSLNVFWRQNQGTGKAAKAPPRGLLPSGLHLQSQGRDSSPTWKPESQARWKLLLLGSPTDISSEHCHPPPAPVPASPPKAEPASPSSCSPQGPATHPLRVTRHWRSPAFRNRPPLSPWGCGP